MSNTFFFFFFVLVLTLRDIDQFYLTFEIVKKNIKKEYMTRTKVLKTSPESIPRSHMVRKTHSPT